MQQDSHPYQPLQFQALPPVPPSDGKMMMKNELKDEESMHQKQSFVEFIVTVEESGQRFKTSLHAHSN